MQNAFQQQMKRDINKIQQSDKLLIPADKTTNYYHLDTQRHDKLLMNNITTAYKKAPTTLEKDITDTDKEIAEKLKMVSDNNKITAKTAKNDAFSREKLGLKATSGQFLGMYELEF